jgi:hypothetical protein
VPKVDMMVEHASLMRDSETKMETAMSEDIVQGQELLEIPKVPEVR